MAPVTSASRPARLLLLPVVLLLQLDAAAAAETNPLRRVITMLQAMKKKVEAEGEKEAKLFDKYQCFCTTGIENLKKSIAEGEKKVPRLQGELTGAREAVVKLANEIEAAKIERENVKQKTEEGAKLRQKDQEAFEKESEEAKANIQALGKATLALEKGMGGGFLQTPAADVLRRLVKTPKVDAASSEVLAVFLSETDGSSAAYEPVSGQVIGICQQMKSTMETELAEMQQNEAQAISDFEALKAASQKELKAITAQIEAKLGRRGKYKVNIVSMEEDLDSSSTALEKDKTFYKDTSEKCSVIETTYREHQGMRSDELVALADAIQILSNDDSLETLKKATSFRQRSKDDDDDDDDDSDAVVSFLQVRKKDVRKEALKLLRLTRAQRHGRGSAKLDLLELALRGRSVGFDKIKKMIDDMIAVLSEEQAADDKKQAYCKKEFDQTDDEIKKATQTVKDFAKEIEDDQNTIKTVEAEIADIVHMISTSDRMVNEATQARKANSGAYVELIASNRAALQIIDMAEKRLFTFYNKKLSNFEPPSHEEETSEVRTKVNPNQFGPGAMTVMKGMTGFAQEPEAPSYKKKSSGTMAVLDMLEKIKGDIRRDSKEAEIEEKNHQGSYELMLKDAADKRETLAKTLTEKETTKSRLTAEVEQMKAEKKSTGKEVTELQKYLANLKDECDWLMSNYGVRKEARKAESEALDRAKDVLSGGKAK